MTRLLHTLVNPWCLGQKRLDTAGVSGKGRKSWKQEFCDIIQNVAEVRAVVQGAVPTSDHFPGEHMPVA